jgi:hypothetical protein
LILVSVCTLLCDLQGDLISFRAMATPGESAKRLQFFINGELYGEYTDVVWNPRWVLVVTLSYDCVLELTPHVKPADPRELMPQANINPKVAALPASAAAAAAVNVGTAVVPFAGRVLFPPHRGEWRDHQVTPTYCCRSRSDLGPGSTRVCRHGASLVRSSHYSCCGVTDPNRGCSAVVPSPPVWLAADEPLATWGTGRACAADSLVFRSNAAQDGYAIAPRSDGVFMCTGRGERRATATANCVLSSGTWYFEVTIVPHPVHGDNRDVWMGWSRPEWISTADNQLGGPGGLSWGFKLDTKDKLHNSRSNDFGERAQVGDTVGMVLVLEDGVRQMHLLVGDKWYGPMFEGFDLGTGFCPAVSCNSNSAFVVRFEARAQKSYALAVQKFPSVRPLALMTTTVSWLRNQWTNPHNAFDPAAWRHGRDGSDQYETKQCNGLGFFFTCAGSFMSCFVSFPLFSTEFHLFPRVVMGVSMNQMTECSPSSAAMGSGSPLVLMSPSPPDFGIGKPL